MRSLAVKLAALPLALWAWLLARPALADTGGIAERTAEDVAQSLVNALKPVLMPVGALIIFAAVAWTALKLIMTANNPQERARVMESLPYILGGGIALGAVFLIAGFIIGLASGLYGK